MRKQLSQITRRRPRTQQIQHVFVNTCVHRPHVYSFVEWNYQGDRPDKKRPRIAGTRSINLTNSKRRFMDSLYDWYRNYLHFEFIRAPRVDPLILSVVLDRRRITVTRVVTLLTRQLKCPSLPAEEFDVCQRGGGLTRRRCLADIAMITR